MAETDPLLPFPSPRKHSEAFIAECKAALSALRGEYNKLLNQKELLDKKLESIRLRATHYTEILKAQDISWHRVEEPVSMTNSDRAYLYLQQVGKPMHVRLIWQELVRQGVKTLSKDPVNMLASTLSNETRFRKTGPRIFAHVPTVEKP